MRQIAAKRGVHAEELLAAGRFGKFSPEIERESRKAEISEGSVLKTMITAFMTPLAPSFPSSDNPFEEFSGYYLKAIESIKGLDYSAKDIGDFNQALAGFQDEEDFGKRAGLFLSALMNSGKESAYIICTIHLEVKPDLIGYRNSSKEIGIDGGVGSWTGAEMAGGRMTVDGDAEGFVGIHMEDGRIDVLGNAGSMVGSGMKGGIICIEGHAGNTVGYLMTGGSITVGEDAGVEVGERMGGGSILIKGSVQSSLGDSMRGGSITVLGDAGEGTGWSMEGGEIHVQGEIAGLYHPKHGKIFHKGKLRFDK